MPESQISSFRLEPRSAGYVRMKSVDARLPISSVNSLLYSDIPILAKSVLDMQSKRSRGQAEEVGLKDFLAQLNRQLTEENASDLGRESELMSDSFNPTVPKADSGEDLLWRSCKMSHDRSKSLKATARIAHDLLSAGPIPDVSQLVQPLNKLKKRNSNIKNLTVSIPGCKRSVPKAVRSARLRSRRTLSNVLHQGHFSSSGLDAHPFRSDVKRKVKPGELRSRHASSFDQKASLNLPRSDPPTPSSVQSDSIGQSTCLLEPISPVSPGLPVLSNMHVPRVQPDSPRSTALAKKQLEDFRKMLSNFLADQKEHEAKIYRRALIAIRASESLPVSLPPPTIPLPQKPAQTPMQTQREISSLPPWSTSTKPSSMTKLQPFSAVHGPLTSMLYADRPMPPPPITQVQHTAHDARAMKQDNRSRSTSIERTLPVPSQSTRHVDSFQAMKDTISRISGHESYARQAKWSTVQPNQLPSIKSAMPRNVISCAVREECMATHVEMVPSLSFSSSASDPSTSSSDGSKTPGNGTRTTSTSSTICPTDYTYF